MLKPKELSLTEAGRTRTLTADIAHHKKGWMRNCKCICGSGKKFKKCCWDKIGN